jgi:regulator of sigma E protease
MLQLLVSIIAFLVAISILVAVHEFGHFWVARRFGIKVLRFSIGFGRPLYRWHDKLGTEYLISAIPLGGYVSLFGEREEIVSPTERQMAFSSKPVFARMLVLLAGPVFNLLLAVFLYWIVFLMGISTWIPILGTIPKDSPAALAGLQAGQEIIAVQEKPTPSWEAVSLQILTDMGEEKHVNVTVRDRATEKIEKRSLDISQLKDGAAEDDWLAQLGFVLADPVPAVINSVLPGYPAAKAGLEKGDRITKVDHQLIHSRSELVEYIQHHVGKEVVLTVSRAKTTLKTTLQPIVKSVDGNNVGFIGIEFITLKDIPQTFMRTQTFGVGEALVKACQRTWHYSVLTLEVLQKMIVGKVSSRHISGPISIAKYAGESALMGFKQFIDFLGLISISLGVLNLLPLPILDGGHVMFCLYEMVVGRPVSQTVYKVAMTAGGILLIAFMILAFYNDITHFILS